MATQTISHTHQHHRRQAANLDASHHLHPSIAFAFSGISEPLSISPTLKSESSNDSTDHLLLATPPKTPLTTTSLTDSSSASPCEIQPFLLPRSGLDSHPIEVKEEPGLSTLVTAAAPRRKKANRACFHCQKAHLTCDDGRPCRRCTRRGLGETCADGVRKKAKYLRDYDDELVVRPGSRPVNALAPSLAPPRPTLVPTPSALSAPGPEPAFTFPALLEHPANRLGLALGLCSPLSAPLSPRSSGQADPSFTTGSDWPDLSEFVSLDSFPSDLLEECWGSQNETAKSQVPPTQSWYRGAEEEASGSPLRPPTPPSSCAAAPSASSSSLSASSSPHREEWLACEEQDWRKPMGRVGSDARFGELEQYLDRRFGNHDDEDVRAIRGTVANLKPECMATQFSINDEDEDLLERAIQRSLVELDRMISVSGTPTAVWRRTGEMVCVGDEFCMLTNCSRSDLLEKKKFIFELFDRSSAVQYFRKFDETAFENSNQQVFIKNCGLIAPDGKVVGCTFCFTIKRDLFNCPSLVIGSFLPILSATPQPNMQVLEVI